MKKCFTFLLPSWFRLPGMIFIVLGIVLGIVRFYYGIKPDFLNVKILALYSSYLQSRSFEVIPNQISEEITGILILTGLFMVAFAKEKKESFRINIFRLRSFIISFYVNTLFLLAAMIFTFGFGFIYMMMVSIISWLAVYLISFRILLYMDQKRHETSKA
jgi:hypothetical protein